MGASQFINRSNFGFLKASGGRLLITGRCYSTGRTSSCIKFERCFTVESPVTVSVKPTLAPIYIRSSESESRSCCVAQLLVYQTPPSSSSSSLQHTICPSAASSSSYHDRRTRRRTPSRIGSIRLQLEQLVTSTYYLVCRLPLNPCLVTHNP